MDRLEDLKTYNILDTSPEQELNELAEIASAIFDTPVSIVSFIDDERQWYKAKIGLDFNEVKIEKTFCKYTLDNPDDILIIDNPLEDVRVKDNELVTCDGGIKFYASAPLVSGHGNVLGTVCVIDYEEKKFSNKKYEALRLISKKVMDYLETRKVMHLQNKEIEYSAERLKRLTDLAPGAIFKLSLNIEGELKFIFMSEGIQRLIPELCPEKLKNDPRILLDFIYGEDRDYVYNLFKYSSQSLIPVEAEYLVHISDEIQKWHWMKANPLKLNNKEVVWYGVIQDITQKKNHLDTLEKMLFDISHVIRKPIANILGIANILQSSEITKLEKMEMCSIIFEETQNLDDYINELNLKYHNLKKLLKKDWTD
ncbi:hypothetical protein SAMN06295967_1165 [Belliella buryatensis]|uniref:histidine kinase n=1 Tax=Belliella buryatensis TaxID=1500549 RepID=A0A239GFD9_9BACT|nr:GAF domain-containing protein [Belliella buryatensis]SNS67761.1 hypothetical protein SAMN06295967_1165 [Belliella buryatensis]